MKRRNLIPSREAAASSAALRALAVLAVAAFLASGCGSSSTNVGAPTAQKCQISVTNFTGTFAAGGGTGSATIDAARECSWSAASQAAWISLGSADGTGAGTLSFTVAANPAARVRSGGLVVNNQQLTVSQAAAACTFKVSVSTDQVPVTGGTGSVNVSSPDGCSWIAASNAPWLQLSAGGGSGSGSVSFSADANTGNARSATLTVAGQSFTVTQPGATAAPTPVPPVPGCQYVVAPTQLSFPGTGGQASLTLSTAPGCTWQATADAWLQLAPTSGSTSATITVSAAANPSAKTRSGTIVLGGQTVAVTEAAAAPTPVQLTGAISKLKGGCPDLRFTLNGTNVATDVNTTYVNTTCDALRNGTQVVVDGLQQPGQPTVQAIRVTGVGN